MLQFILNLFTGTKTDPKFCLQPHIPTKILFLNKLNLNGFWQSLK